MTHIESYQFEKYVPKSEHNWISWANSVEEILKHSIDGDQSSDGYSLDYAYDWFKLGSTAYEYASNVRKMPQYKQQASIV